MIEQLAQLPWKSIIPTGAIFALLGYLGRRWIERSQESEDLRRWHDWIDLRKKLNEQQIDVDELKAFRHRVQEQRVRAAADTAQHYIDRAENLVAVAGREDGADDGQRAAPSEPSEFQTQADMSAYAYELLQQAEDQLKAVVLDATQQMTDPELAAFNASQEAWLAWRLREAEWESSAWEGGSIRPVMVATKLESLTRERIATLQASGDLASEPLIRIPLRSTPRNLFDHVLPGLSAPRAREILGMPHYIDWNRWTYRYAEAQLELSIRDEIVEEVALAMCEGQTLCLDFVYFDLVLGQATFADLLAAEPNIEICYRSSNRTFEIYAKVMVGPAGSWRPFYFGALEALHGSGQLLGTDFTWDREQNKLVSDPSATLINWVGISNSVEDDPPAFAWNIT